MCHHGFQPPFLFLCQLQQFVQLLVLRPDLHPAGQRAVVMTEDPVINCCHSFFVFFVAQIGAEAADSPGGFTLVIAEREPVYTGICRQPADKCLQAAVFEMAAL